MQPLPFKGRLKSVALATGRFVATMSVRTLRFANRQAGCAGRFCARHFARLASRLAERVLIHYRHPLFRPPAENNAEKAEQAAAPEMLRNAIIDMAVESWRFGRVFDRLLMKLDAGEQKRYQSQFRWFLKKVEEGLEQAELKLVNLEGHPFDPGMSATPLNIDEFAPDDALVVEQMLEPVIMGREGLVKTGTVTLRRVEP